MSEQYSHSLPMGATPDGKGTHFVFYAGNNAENVDLRLFDDEGKQEIRRCNLKKAEKIEEGGKEFGWLWHVFVPGVTAGQLYGFRVAGPWEPEKNNFFNHNKLLVDPAAKAVTGEVDTWSDPRHSLEDGGRNLDNAAIMPKARVVDCKALYQRARLEGTDRPLGALHTLADTNIYEAHVRDFTYRLPGLSTEERGTYKALGNDKVIGWLQEQGYTSLELLPVESFGTDPPLAKREGRKNHWGYQTGNPMAVHTGYAASGQRGALQEFMEAIRKLRSRGIETIMDIVPNHTLESGIRESTERGPNTGNYHPLYNLRGMDGNLYHSANNNLTGAGNARDFSHPINRRLFLEELRHWKNLGVSGFRIDLASVLGRSHDGSYDSHSPMMEILHGTYKGKLPWLQEDANLRWLGDIKLFGEPYDIDGQYFGDIAHYHEDGEREDGAIRSRGYNHITEWDSGYLERMNVAALNRDQDLQRGELSNLLGGSDKRFPGGKYLDPMEHIIALVKHDWPTLDDCVSYPTKDNRANGEVDEQHPNGRDGNNIPPGCYYGNVPNAEEAKLRVERFAIALTMISQGIPMTYSGSERAHTLQGNTNPYCYNHSNENSDAREEERRAFAIPWEDEMSERGHKIMTFAALAGKVRADHASLRRATYFPTKDEHPQDLSCPYRFGGDEHLKQVTWLNREGKEMTDQEWNAPGGLGMMLSGDPGNSSKEETSFVRRVQRSQHDMPLLILINPHPPGKDYSDITFKLPVVPGVEWEPRLNSEDGTGPCKERHSGGEKVKVGWKSLIVFEAVPKIEIAPGQGATSPAAAAPSR